MLRNMLNTERNWAGLQGSGKRQRPFSSVEPKCEWRTWWRWAGKGGQSKANHNGCLWLCTSAALAEGAN